MGSTTSQDVSESIYEDDLEAFQTHCSKLLKESSNEKDRATLQEKFKKDPDLYRFKGRTPLACAMLRRNLEMLKDLFDPSKFPVEAQKDFGLDPLQFSSETGSSPLNDFFSGLFNDHRSGHFISIHVTKTDVEVLKFLLDIDPVRNNEKLVTHREPASGLAPLEQLSVFRCSDNDDESKKNIAIMAEELLANGADVNSCYVISEKMRQNASQDTSFAGKNFGQALAANPLVRYAIQSYTPLHLASLFGNQHLVGTLLAAKANVNVVTTNNDTPIMLAITGGHPEIFNLLLGQPGIDLEVVSLVGYNVLLLSILQYRVRPRNARVIDTELSSSVSMDELKKLAVRYHKTPADPMPTVEQGGVDLKVFLTTILSRPQDKRPKIRLPEKAAEQMQVGLKYQANSGIVFPQVQCLMSWMDSVAFNYLTQRFIPPSLRNDRTILGGDTTMSDEYYEHLTMLIREHCDPEEKQLELKYMRSKMM